MASLVIRKTFDIFDYGILTLLFNCATVEDAMSLLQNFYPA